MQKSRVFIAIPIPEKIRQYIREELSKLNLSVKLIPETNYHITVLFLGDIENCELDGLIQSLQVIAESISGFQLRLHSIITKSNAHHSMLWAAFDQSRFFEELTAKIALSLNQTINKKPIPHINLVRSKKKIKGPFPVRLNEGKIHVTSIELWRSILHPEGATYSVIASFSLVSTQNET